MKKISRRELFKRTGQIGIGGAALVVGLKTVGAATDQEEANIIVRSSGDPPFKDLPHFCYIRGKKYEYVLPRPCSGGLGQGSGPHFEYFTKRSGRWRQILGGYWIDT